MPNGGHAARPEELGPYRKSDIARLEASHADLLAACKAARRVIVHSRQRAKWLTQPWVKILDNLDAVITKATQLPEVKQ